MPFCLRAARLSAVFAFVMPSVALATAPPPDYRQAYIYALRCFVVDGSYGDKPGAQRAFDAAMKLGHLQNLSNRQLNADLDEWTATEQVKTLRDPQYRMRLIGECRKLGLASSG